MKKTFTKVQKAKWIKTAQSHQDADRFIQGAWLRDNETEEGMHRGCFFGCMMQTENSVLSTAVEKMNLPDRIIYVAEKIFEGLPKEEAALRPVQLLEAIPTGKDIEQAWKNFQYRLLMDPVHGNIAYANGRQDLIDAIKQCAALYKMDKITESAAWSAAESARSAAESAARSAAESAAWSAAWSAWSAAESAARSAAESAESAAWSAESAARSAAWSAESAARLNHYQWMREVLIEELKAL